MRAGLLLKYPAGFISLKASSRDGEWNDYGLSLKGRTVVDGMHFGFFALKPVTQAVMHSSPYTKAAGVLLVVLAHAGLLYMMMGDSEQPVIQEAATPITVSIIAPPAPEPVPEPEVVPIIKPVKVAKKVVIKPKEVVRKIVPVENPEQPLVEATTEPVVEQQQAEVEEAAPIVEQKLAAKPAAAEEVIEQPQFGVAYLNNPAPSYPRLSRRMGEEGRVLLKVLVSAEGAANLVSIEKSSGSTRLDQSALEAVKRWRFIPARKGGQTLSAYVLVPINFSLDS